MKVICIDGVKSGSITMMGNIISKENEIYEGEEYTVQRQVDDCYLLVERPGFLLYKKKRFAPISKIDETTFERNYNKELV
jgi:hypothetical protein